MHGPSNLFGSYHGRPHNQGTAHVIAMLTNTGIATRTEIEFVLNNTNKPEIVWKWAAWRDEYRRRRLTQPEIYTSDEV